MNNCSHCDNRLMHGFTAYCADPKCKCNNCMFSLKDTIESLEEYSNKQYDFVLLDLINFYQKSNHKSLSGLLVNLNTLLDTRVSM